MRERDNVLVAFPDVRGGARATAPRAAPVVLDPAKADGFPKGWVVSDRAALDVERRQQARVLRHQGAGRRRPTRRAPDDRRGRRRGRLEHARRADPVAADDPRRSRIATSRSGRRSTCRRRRSSSSPTRRCATSTSRRTASGRSAATRAATSTTTSAPAADIYRVNTTTGERTLMLKGQLTGRHVFGISPDGTHVPVLEGQQVPGVRPRRGARRGRSAAAAASSFVDMEFDHPGPKPSYGIAGYTQRRQGASIAQHRYDLWLLPLDGSAPTQPDERRRHQERDPLPHRPDRAGRSVPTAAAAVGAARRRSTSSKPVTLSAYGEWTKKAGFYELAGGQLKELVYEDASFSTPVQRARRPTGTCSRARRSSSSRTCASRARLQGLEEDHATPTRSRRSSCGATASCSTTRTRTACGCRASSRCPTTTSRARSGRCS